MSEPLLAPWGPMGLVPTESNGVSAMSRKTRALLLAGYDPTVVLEAASTVLAQVEMEKGDVIEGWLRGPDRGDIQRFRERCIREGSTPAECPLHPLAVLAALRLALGQASPGLRTDAIRQELVENIVRVALRFNTDVIEVTEGTYEELSAFLARTSLWRALQQEHWLIWSGELVVGLMSHGPAQPHLDAFRRATGLTLEEWFCRTAGEFAVRHKHGARSWGSSKDIDADLERLWLEVVTLSPEDARARAERSLSTERKYRFVADPFDLSWLAERPMAMAEGTRRFAVWLGALIRYVTPASIAQVLKETTGALYDQMAQMVGDVGHRLIEQAITDAPPLPGEFRIADLDHAYEGKKGDYLIEHDGKLLVAEFTILSPTRGVYQGDDAALQKLAELMAKKLAQAVATLKWRDPSHSLRWLPVLVLESPMALDITMIEAARVILETQGIIDPGRAELTVCHVTDFLDLVAHARNASMSLPQAVAEWRDGRYGGSSLDWWIYDQGFGQQSGRERVKDVVSHCVEVMKNRSAAQEPGTGPAESALR